MSGVERWRARVSREGEAACVRSLGIEARDFIMNAAQAKDYGIVDDIIFKHK